LAQQSSQPAQSRNGAAAPKAQQAPASGGQRGGASGTSQAKPGAGTTAGKPGSKQDPAKSAPAGAPGGGQATALATFNDWTAYATGQGRAKICYALSQPKDRQPKDLKRDPAYLFVSFRPAESVKHEVAVVMGFATKDGGAAEATIGNSTYALITKGANAWVKNPSEEPQVIGTMSKNQAMTIKATSGRGNPTTDRYSLAGFAQALDRARKECP
jgi:hypothetical protein